MLAVFSFFGHRYRVCCIGELPIESLGGRAGPFYTMRFCTTHLCKFFDLKEQDGVFHVVGSPTSQLKWEVRKHPKNRATSRRPKLPFFEPQFCQAHLKTMCITVNRVPFLLPLFVFGLVAGCGGGGQAHDSPDGRFEASAAIYSSMIKYRIRDNQSGKVVWHHDESAQNVDPPYMGGFGNFEYIQWSDDSDEVRFATKCVNTTDPVEWIATALVADMFEDGIKTDEGLRPANRLER